jgi:hypothetical protein
LILSVGYREEKYPIIVVFPKYFIKKTLILYRERKPPSGCGIEVNSGVIAFYLRQYFNDFKNAQRKLKEKYKKNKKMEKFVTETFPNLSTFNMSGYAVGDIGIISRTKFANP